jgi:multiple sugar transport system permease protein
VTVQDRATTAPATLAGAPLGARRPPRRRRSALPILLLLPASALLLTVLVVPIGVAIYSSFFDINILNLAQQTFVGLDNYRRMATSADFWSALRVTAIYTAVVVAGGYLLGLVTALLLRRPFRGRGIARTLAIMPWAVPSVVTVLVWTWILDTNYGVLNYVLRSVGAVSKGVPWLERGGTALVAVIMVSIWSLYPVAVTMLLAGLQSINEELYEAAAVDGAGRWQRFRYVTWPGLAPVNLVLFLLLGLLAFTRVVTIIYVMTGGGPGRATETLPLQTYLEAFKYRELGYASAVGTSVLMLALLFSGLYLRLARRILPEARA